jgi:hypothetical protein
MSGKSPVTVHDCQIDVHHDRSTLASMDIPRRVSVKGMEGANVTVVVTVVQGKVWMSIRPPFSWEAIMEPGKIDELIHVLELARDDAKKIAIPGRRVIPGDGAALRAITKGAPAT